MMVILIFAFFFVAASCDTFDAAEDDGLANLYETDPGSWYDKESGITYVTEFGDWHAYGYVRNSSQNEDQSVEPLGVALRYFRERRGLPKLWPTNVIPYAIDSKFEQYEKWLILVAMEDIELISCVKFRPYHQGDRSVLKIRIEDDRCYSTSVGYSSHNEINLGTNCLVNHIIVHELFHALGFNHQQAASNRDKYVKIHWDNIQPGFEPQFEKVSIDTPAERQVGYDYKSITHYTPYHFAIDTSRPTISPKDPYVTLVRNTKMSQKDIMKLNIMYKCDY